MYSLGTRRLGDRRSVSASARTRDEYNLLKVAEIKGVPVEKVIDAVRKNVFRIYWI